MALETGTATGRSGQGPWSGGDRLPVAPRQRRPAIAALALLLILGGGLISAVLVLRSGDKQAVIAIRTDVAQGHVFDLSDLASVQVAVPDELGAVPWAQRSDVVGRTATVGMKRGTLLNRLATTADPPLAKDEVAIGVDLRPGVNCAAEGVSAGDDVRVWFAPSASGSTAALPQELTSLKGQALINKARVLYVGRVRSDGSLAATLIVMDTEGRLLGIANKLQAIYVSTLAPGA